MSHGTSGYAKGCRCEQCRSAKRDYERQRYAGRQPHEPRRYSPRLHAPRLHEPRPYAPRPYKSVNRELLREALQELFPMGLTDDCPARRGQR